MPKQYQRLNIKSQNDKLKCKNLPHSALCFSSFAFSGIATPSARNDRGEIHPHLIPLPSRGRRLLEIATPEPALSGEILPLHFIQGQNDSKRRGSQ